MRRGEKPPPVYAASKLGSARTLPFTRPSEDSLPKHECGVNGCGKPGGKVSLDWEMTPYNVSYTARAKKPFDRRFCSLGCLGRWAALQEIRQ